MTIRIGANNSVRRTSGWLVGSFLLAGLTMTLLHGPAALADDPCTKNFIPIPT